ncbi:hypothetical protein BGZ61DRAFT_25936 [Ilyonectria robusta]|uniref:uncharacterized protein n=1 Tax=Ilyonectria robusta TaxID=1079257 RepID=UPI001E8D713E|nr:uncharacterized protein BGZ61DRAFT_25936 [Ilyonectria robusta]KAH8737982.1 hypothetical protein BGZ61DRAFT_25936 [Ilyonectria robusta]
MFHASCTSHGRLCTAQPAMSGTSNRPAARAKRSSPFPSRSAPTTVRHAQQAAGAHGARTWSALAVSGRGREEVDVRYVHVAPGVQLVTGALAGGGGEMRWPRWELHGRDRRGWRRGGPRESEGCQVVFLSVSIWFPRPRRDMAYDTNHTPARERAGLWAMGNGHSLRRRTRRPFRGPHQVEGSGEATYSVWSKPWPWVPTSKRPLPRFHPSSMIHPP